MRTAGQLIGLATIALLAASASAAPVADVKARQFFPFDDFFPGETEDSGNSALGVGVSGGNSNGNAAVSGGGGIDNTVAVAAATSAPSAGVSRRELPEALEKRQFFPFFDLPELPSASSTANSGNSQLGVGVSGGSGNGNAAVNGGGGIGNTVHSASDAAASGSPLKRQFFPDFEDFGFDFPSTTTNSGNSQLGNGVSGGSSNGNAAVNGGAGIGNTAQSASGAAASGSPSKRQFFPDFEDFGFDFPASTTTNSGNSQLGDGVSGGNSNGNAGVDGGAGIGNTVNSAPVAATSGSA